METPVEMPVKKDKKTGAIIGTVVASLLCGCPGLLACPGGIAIVAGAWENDIPPAWGALPLCLSPIFIAIPIVIGVLTLKKKKPAEGDVSLQEPLPPAS